MSAGPIRIGFDARLAGSRHAGIGRYAENLLRYLLEEIHVAEGRPIQWVVFVAQEHDLSWLESLGDTVEIRHVCIRHYSVAEQILWPQILMRAKLDLLHVPHFNVPVLYTLPFTVTIHDLLWHQQRDPRATTLLPWMHRLKYGAYRLVSWMAIRRAKYVFVPSKVVQKEVARATGRVRSVRVTPEGVGEPYRSATISENSKDFKAASAPYCVYTGSLYPHKNVEVILRALRRVPQMRLVLASSRSVFTERFLEQAERYGVASQVEWRGYVPDTEMISLYRSATALIQPSLSEGFGLTGLEALAVGARVIAADIPIFHEVYGECAEYFPPRDGYALSELLERFGEVAPALSERRRNRRHALTYSWQIMGEQTWEKMRVVIQQNQQKAV